MALWHVDEEALTILRRVADGEMAVIRAETWLPGYGSE